MASASRRVGYLPMRTRNVRAEPFGGVVTNDGYPLPASRDAIVSASRRSLTAATCTTKPVPAGSSRDAVTGAAAAEALLDAPPVFVRVAVFWSWRTGFA